MPAPLAVPGTLHHVEINVSDLPASVAFWGWLLQRLGYVPYQSWPQGRSWRLGPTYVVLVTSRADHRTGAFDRRATGLNHLAFHVPTPSDVDALTVALEREGTPVLYRDRHPHAGGGDSYAVFFEDPDRLKVEVTASLALARPAADLLALYVVAHNDGVRSGDFEPMLALFHDDARLSFHGLAVAPVQGRASIRAAFAERPPGDALHVVDVASESVRRAHARYAWEADLAHPAGRLTLAAEHGSIRSLDVFVEPAAG